MPAFRAGTVRAALARKGPFQKREAPLGLQPAGTLGRTLAPEVHLLLVRNQAPAVVDLEVRLQLAVLV